MSETITPEERAELRSALEHATKLPYYFMHNPDAMSHVVWSANHNAGEIGTWLFKQDARYVVAACNLAPRILNALEAAEVESTKLREQVSALRELNEAGMDLMDAGMATDEASSAHYNYKAGRTLSTETRLKNARVSLFAAYDKATKAREKCEALGLNVTPCQQGPHNV